MIMIFVDGAIHHLRKKPDRLCEGGVGAVVVTNELGANAVSIFAAARYVSQSPKVTNQRLELEAVRHGIETVESLGLTGRPLYLWSDSEYALGNLGPSDWNPSKNMDLIVPIQRLIRSSGPVLFHHVRSHIKRKSAGKLPDHIFHEMADVIAGASVRKRTSAGGFVHQAAGLDPECLTCQRFGCWQKTSPLESLIVESGGSRCDSFAAWDKWAIKGFQPEEVRNAWTTQLKTP